MTGKAAFVAAFPFARLRRRARAMPRPAAAPAAIGGEAAAHEHVRLSGLPASKVSKVHRIIDPMKRLNDAVGAAFASRNFGDVHQATP